MTRSPEADLNETVRVLAAQAHLAAPPVRITTARRARTRDNAGIYRRRDLIRLDVGPDVLGWSAGRVKAIVAHELGHVNQPRSGIQRLPEWLAWTTAAAFMLAALVYLTAATVGVIPPEALTIGAPVGAGIVFVVMDLQCRRSRRLELDADAFAQRLVGHELVVADLRALMAAHPDPTSRHLLGRWMNRRLRTHPPTADRIAAIENRSAIRRIA